MEKSRSALILICVLVRYGGYTSFGRTPFGQKTFHRHKKKIRKSNEWFVVASTKRCVGEMSVGQMFFDQKTSNQDMQSNV